MIHYFEAIVKPNKKPEVRVVGQMAILSNFSFKCTSVAPLLEDYTISGVVLKIGGSVLRVRNPIFHNFTITGRQIF